MKTKTSVTRDELKQMMLTKTKFVLLDVRSPEEFENGHISFAENIPLALIEQNKFIPEPDTIVITACGKGGGRSESGADYIRSNSASAVYFLEGGTFGWLENEKK